MTMEATRRERRRAGSKRARVRVSRDKVDRFLKMRAENRPRGFMAAALGLRPRVIDELLEIAESEAKEAEAVEAGGGGG